MQKLRCPAIHKGDALRQNRRLPVYEIEKQRIDFIRFVKMKLILFVSNALRAYCIARKNAGCMFLPLLSLTKGTVVRFLCSVQSLIGSLDQLHIIIIGAGDNSTGG